MAVRLDVLQWLVPMDDLSDEYDVDDILPAMAGGLSYEGTLYAAPFYGESSMIMYLSLIHI